MDMWSICWFANTSGNNAISMEHWCCGVRKSAPGRKCADFIIVIFSYMYFRPLQSRYIRDCANCSNCTNMFLQSRFESHRVNELSNKFYTNYILQTRRSIKGRPICHGIKWKITCILAHRSRTERSSMSSKSRCQRVIDRLTAPDFTQCHEQQPTLCAVNVNNLLLFCHQSNTVQSVEPT